MSVDFFQRLNMVLSTYFQYDPRVDSLFTVSVLETINGSVRDGDLFIILAEITNNYLFQTSQSSLFIFIYMVLMISSLIVIKCITFQRFRS